MTRAKWNSPSSKTRGEKNSPEVRPGSAVVSAGCSNGRCFHGGRFVSWLEITGVMSGSPRIQKPYLPFRARS